MVAANLYACTLAIDLSILPPSNLIPLIQLGESELVDFKENLLNDSCAVYK